MAQGFPTPPPTTETEFLDEARDSVASTSAISNIVPPPVVLASNLNSGPDVYQEIFTHIADLASQGNFEELIQVAELHDLHGENDASYTRLLLTAPLVLAYLIRDDLIPAQYALTRLPENLQTVSLSGSLMSILASTQERKYEDVYSRAQNLHHKAQQSDFLDEKLGSLVATLITTFIDSFRRRTFTLLSRAYSSISVALAQKYLGVGQEQLLSVANSSGWRYDGSDQLLYPTTTNIEASTGIQFSASSLDTFHVVADGVTKLEA
ncbi:hypothetical protein SERLA73DRAFT_162440 [Serpula lacrymans var. lacrymans S7.3]|uniref:CSN8/PSMD8/EIF3K domain-containing protein n=2 Tax=Serpula lacrymans var. lacrymans TaxID=341189 RepID=F8Q7V7_SERL3|nr:uncharacterized protein SERLADRAFT_476005 [Serpula lacrymans var. lacrymans S7.9]EGN95645.1 hypothetical protein SERLA73DRAFT_162440 [Serpula lacrymans var. lacrymans S7.3]EGO21172.1 hypothetical protein SERLADRAFT_476005 [Serpula lacrymans var. lacrymans S7.9]